MEAEKKQRGGARLGAGRKKTDNARNNRASFMLSSKALETLERMALEGNTTKNDVINKILENL